jgi:trigger factor
VYRQALTEARIDPVNEPDLQDVTLEEGAPLSFTAVVEVKPTIALTDYRGVEVQHAPAAVTDDDVARALEAMREQHAQYNSVERAAAAGDLVIVDYTLAPDDHEPTKAEGYHFLVGGGTVLPEIDTAVVGMTAGEEREVGLRFADDHRMESLRGKAGTARIKLGEVKEKLLPTLDDEFAKGLGEFDTLDAVRAEVRRQLEARREAESRQALEDKIMEVLLARHDFGVPEAMVMRQVAHQVEHTRERLRRQGVDPDGIQWDYGKIVGELRPGAEKAVRRALLLEAIAAKEAVVATDEEMDAEVEKFARASQRPAPAVRRMMEKSGDLESLRHGLRERKTLNLLVEHARLT